VPDALYTKLTYTKGFQQVLSAAQINTGNINIGYLNDPFDPDPDLGNFSAQGFDFWRDYYNNYIVSRSSVTVKVTGLSSFPSYAAIMPQCGTSLPAVTGATGLQYWQNLPRVRYRWINPAGANKQTVTLKTGWSIKKDAGYQNRSATFETSGWSAATNASPIQRRQLNFWLSTVINNTLGADTGFHCTVRFVYHCRFYGRKATPELLDPE